MNTNNISKKELSAQEREELLSTLQSRFEKHKPRHQGIAWTDVQAKLEAAPEKLWSLNEMENTGGEPDVVGADSKTGEVIFFDCAKESPKGRRSICYDRDARVNRKKFPPENSCLEMADAMGVEMMTEGEYYNLQKLGEFDLKTSSWVATPDDVRKLDGAIFCDRRFGRVFTFHNTADCYYGSRGFRASLRV